MTRGRDAAVRKTGMEIMTTMDRHQIRSHENPGLQKTYLVIGDADNGNSIGINPDIILCEIHAVLLEVLAAIAELLPLLLPLANGFVQSARKVGIFTFVGMDRLLRAFEFNRDTFQILTLDKGTLGGIRIDAKTILLVFLAGLVNMGFLRLLRLELFLD